MKNTVKAKPWVSVTSVLLAVFFLIMTFLSVVVLSVTVNDNYYNRSCEDIKKEEIQHKLNNISNDLIFDLSMGKNVDKYVGSSFLYEIKDGDNNVIFSNTKGESFVPLSVHNSEYYRLISGDYCEVDYEDYYEMFGEHIDGNVEHSTSVSVMIESTEKNLNNESAEIFVFPIRSKLIDFIPLGKVNPEEYENYYKDGVSYYEVYDMYKYQMNFNNFTVSMGIDENAVNKDELYYLGSIVDLCYSLRYYIFVFLVVGIIGLFTSSVFACSCAGYSRNGTRSNAKWFNYIPIEVILGLIAGAGGLDGVIISEASNNFMLLFPVLASITIMGSIILVLSMVVIASDIKTRGVKCSLILWFLSFVIKKFKYIFKNIGLVWKTLITALIIFIGNLVILMSLEYSDFAVVWFIESLVLIPFIIYIVISLRKIQKTGDDIVSGKVDAQVDTSKMFGSFKDFGETLNNINSGLSNAVDEKMKSERLKTALITNVSHDIKTPLTSIINYIDLAKKEDIQNEKLCEYVNILDKQSARLKKLIEDLIEASKASTGNIKPKFEFCDVSILLQQAVGEYEDRLVQNELTPIVEYPAEGVNIRADSRLLWRVFDNLLSNICKYSLKGTRVYLTVKKQENKCIIQFKNISRDQLNISEDELMERFIRGDSSRNTEGSGLGLSIAQSLIAIQNAQLKIDIIGDLFTATVFFNIY